jgi:hypothetical protein
VSRSKFGFLVGRRKIGPVERGFGKALRAATWIDDTHAASVALARALAKELDDGLGDGRALGSIANSYGKILNDLKMTPVSSPAVAVSEGRLAELLEVHDE